MPVTLVVDGYNAINAISAVRKEMDKSLLSARQSIIALSREYARSSGYISNVRVVFDGDDKYRKDPVLNRLRGKDQVFSETGRGDDKIIQTVKECSRYGRGCPGF
ncbi:MAG: NYN domain-containing protein [Candidatus Omnitrophota bacterium]